MRVTGYGLIGLSLLLAGAGVLVNLWAQGMACGFATGTGPCRLRWPWQMAGEDLVLLVLLPFGAALLAALAGRALLRRRS